MRPLAIIGLLGILLGSIPEPEWARASEPTRIHLPLLSEGRLRAAASFSSPALAVLPAGTVVEILSRDGLYYQVAAADTLGFVVFAIVPQDARLKSVPMLKEYVEVSPPTSVAAIGALDRDPGSVTGELARTNADPVMVASVPAADPAYADVATPAIVAAPVETPIESAIVPASIETPIESAIVTASVEAPAAPFIQTAAVEPEAETTPPPEAMETAAEIAMASDAMQPVAESAPAPEATEPEAAVPTEAIEPAPESVVAAEATEPVVEAAPLTETMEPAVEAGPSEAMEPAAESAPSPDVVELVTETVVEEAIEPVIETAVAPEAAEPAVESEATPEATEPAEESAPTPEATIDATALEVPAVNAANDELDSPTSSESSAPPTAADRSAELVARYGEPIASRLIAGEVWAGMTAEMAREVRGEPLRIHRTVTSEFVHEMWIFSTIYLYLDNGVVTGLQDSPH